MKRIFLGFLLISGGLYGAASSAHDSSSSDQENIFSPNGNNWSVVPTDELEVFEVKEDCKDAISRPGTPELLRGMTRSPKHFSDLSALAQDSSEESSEESEEAMSKPDTSERLRGMTRSPKHFSGLSALAQSDSSEAPTQLPKAQTQLPTAEEVQHKIDQLKNVLIEKDSPVYSSGPGRASSWITPEVAKEIFGSTSGSITDDY